MTQESEQRSIKLFCPVVGAGCQDPTCGYSFGSGLRRGSRECGLSIGRPPVKSDNNEQQMIHGCMERLSKRYRAAQAATSVAQIRDDYPAAQQLRTQLREWFEARMDYLQEEYRMSINRCENIIGKQWLYDQRAQLRHDTR